MKFVLSAYITTQDCYALDKHVFDPTKPSRRPFKAATEHETLTGECFEEKAAGCFCFSQI